jgi:glycerol-3-phosphate dehydrogenase
MNRAEQFASLSRPSGFDLAVVGGGATGLGVALDAALRGFSVVLLESHDFAGGTSSRSTKLLHGGVRYLAQGNVALVREALAERTTVMRCAPHLAQPLPFVMPAYRWWQMPFYGVGLKLYDLLAGSAGLGRTEFLNADRTQAVLPGVNANALRGGVKYWDGQFDDARLALALAQTAEAAGATVLNHARVTAIRREAQEAEQPRFSVDVSDRFSEKTQTVRVRCVVNATGVWVDELRSVTRGAEPQAPRQRMVSPSQGVHVVVDRAFLGGDHALLVPKTPDGRVLFAVPWLGKVVLGTTDTPRDDLPREPVAFEEEVAFILSEASRALSRPVRRSDVRSVWVGLRPLVAVAQQAEGATKTLSREHTIVTDPSGLITVTGGKWTTYRAMAEDVLEHCFRGGFLPARPGGRTEHHPLVGAPVQKASGLQPLQAPPGLHLLGSEAARVAALPGHEVVLGMGLTEAMVRFFVRVEKALTVEDVLARRWRVLFLDATQAASMAPRVAEILREEGCPEPALPPFLALCRQYALQPAADPL